MANVIDKSLIDRHYQNMPGARKWPHFAHFFHVQMQGRSFTTTLLLLPIHHTYKASGKGKTGVMTNKNLYLICS